MTNRPSIENKMRKGSRPARRSLIFSISGMSISSWSTVGASFGLMRQTTIT